VEKVAEYTRINGHDGRVASKLFLYVERTLEANTPAMAAPLLFGGAPSWAAVIVAKKDIDGSIRPGFAVLKDARVDRFIVLVRVPPEHSSYRGGRSLVDFHEQDIVSNCQVGG
jgi:hypothetical protein